MQALLAQPISKLDQVSAGTVSNTITTSSNTIQASISDRLSNLFQSLALLIAAYGIAFRYSWSLTLVTSSSLLFIIFVLSLTAPRVIKIQQSIDKADAKHASIAGEIFGSIRTVFSLGAEAALSRRYYSWVDESKKRGLKIAPMIGVHLGPIFFSMYASFALAFWFGLKLYREGHIASVGSVIVVIFSILIVVSVLGNILQPLMMIFKAISASTEFFDMIDSGEVPADGRSGPAASAQQDIIFRDVTFSYPTRPGVQVLHGLNARFQRGKTTALVGPSGSGKSTIVALLERWYDLDGSLTEHQETVELSDSIEKVSLRETPPAKRVESHPTSSGSISCGDLDITSFNLKWWRTQIGLVQQEPFLFNDSIFSNVAAGLIGTQWESCNDETKLELVKTACKEASADEFIDKLPKGYSTMVGESGIKLSGGQRQRIAIARSVIRQPVILILDEATSAIDVRRERIVQEALDRVSQDRTTIVIAHRLATIRKADHIIVLRNGRNLEEGSHDQLIAMQDGLYKGLLQAQRLEHQSAEEYVEASESNLPGLQRSCSLHSEAKDTGGTDPTETPYKPKGFYKIIGSFLYEQKRHWLLYAIFLAGALGAATAFPLQSYFFAKVVQVFEFTGSRLVHEGNFWSLMFFVLALGMAVSYLVLGYASTALGAYFGCAYRKDYFSSIIRKPISFYDKEGNSSGAFMSRLSTDPKQLLELFGINGAFPLISIFNLIGCITISFSFGWKLTLVAIFAALPVLLISQFIRIRHEIQFEKRNSAVFAESSTFATEAVSAMRTVLSLTMEDAILRRYSNMLHSLTRKSTRKASYSMAVVALCQSVELLPMALTFWYGGQLLASYEYNPVQFLVIYIAVVQGGQGAGQFFSFGPNIAQATASANRILNLRESSRGRAPVASRPVPTLDAVSGASVELKNVTFQYPTRDTPIFRDLSISIQSGQFVGLVGPSGCGKTSVVSLLERFYEPTSGVILLNSTDVRTIDLATYRAQLSLVAQEPKLFEGTIKENLLLGVETDSVTEELMHQACRDAEIHDFILSLPDGYSTELGINTSTALSGGQKQRLCLARALLRKPKLLLLDEATSSLDSQSERLVQAAIERLAGSRSMTVVAVAHRLATIQKADCIFVFGESEVGMGSTVVERGVHLELLAKKGAYWSMCQGQALDR
jgi:ATP-binding cassette, subfamily B (MDR/TAP), member 1